MLEKLILPAKRKKDIKGLAKLFSDAGFTKLSYKGNRLILERSEQGLKGEEILVYRVIFFPDRIEFIYETDEKGKMKKIIEMYPILLNILKVAEKNYTVDASALYTYLNEAFKTISSVINHDSLELSSELKELKAKYDVLMKKYNDLVVSSEQNAKILIQAEQRIEELEKRIKELEGMSDESLKQEVFSWLKLHNGKINIKEFCSIYNLAPRRVEEILESLIKEGYIRRKE